MMNISELYRGCRSFRRFKQEPLPEELLHEMMENARIASSAHNAQPGRYVVVTKKEVLEAMHPLVVFASSLPRELGEPKADEQPTAYVVVSKMAGADESFCDMDLGLAVDAMVMTAWEAGFGSCLLGSINIPEIQKLLSIPEEETIRLVVAFGKPDHESTLVGPREDGSLKYYLDDEKNYYVPKRSFEEVVRFI